MDRGGDDLGKPEDHRPDHDGESGVLIVFDFLADRERRHLDDDDERDGEDDQAHCYEEGRGNRVV